MGLNITTTKKEDKEYHNLKLADADHGDTFTLRLFSPEPLTGQGKFGLWEMFRGDLLSINGQPDGRQVSFFAGKQRADYPKTVSDVLKACNAGDELTFTANFKKGKKHIFLVWDIKGGSSNDTGSSDENSNDERLSLDASSAIIAELKGLPEKLNSEEVKDYLREAGITNKEDIIAITTAYMVTLNNE